MKLLRILQQTFWQALVKFSTTICGLIILGLITRQYGENGTGEFTLGLVYLSFFYILVDFAFNAHILSKFQSSSVELEWRKLLGVRIIWGVFLTLLAVLILLLLPYHPPLLGFSPNFKLVAIFGLANIFLQGIITTSSGLFQAKLKYQFNIFGPIFGAILGTLLIFYLTHLKLPAYFVVLGYLIAWFSEASFSLIFVKKIINNIYPIFDLSYLKKLILEVWPFSSTLVLNVIYFRADAFMLQYFHPSAEVGTYNVAYQIFQAILVLPTYIMNSFYPMMIQTFRLNIASFIAQVKKAAIGLLTLSLIISFIIYFLSPFIIRTITGGGFVGSSTSLRILSLAFPAYFLSALLMWVMVTKKMYKKLLIIYSLGLFFNLVANLILIPKYSYIAASWNTGISEYFILIMQLVMLRWSR